MAKRKTKNLLPTLSISDLFLLRKYCSYLLNNIEDSGLPKDVWIQVANCLDKLEEFMRHGIAITYEDLIYVKGKQKIKAYDERNILIFAMVMYLNREDVDDYEAFTMRDIEEKIGNPHYLKDTRQMEPLWFTEMELKRGNELLDY